MNTITWTTDSMGGGSLRGYYESPWMFEETVARLASASGQPAATSDGYKTSVEFTGTFKGHSFALYDYKEDRAIHIGGGDQLNLAGLVDALNTQLASVEPTPYSAKEYYDQRRGHGWPNAT